MMIRGKPLQFGVGAGYSYIFPDDVQSFDPRFGNVTPAASRVIGASGGVDEYGRGVHSTGFGNINMSFWVVRDSVAAIREDIDALNGLIALGTQPLIFDHGDHVRWCWAYLNNPQITFNSSNAHLNHQRVQLDFRVDDPHWYAVPGGPTWLDNDQLWGTGAQGSNPRVDQTTVTDGSTVSVTNNGNMYTPAAICWAVDGGSGTVVNPRIYRKNRSGQIEDDLLYTGSLVDGQVVRIDAHDYSVPVGDIDNLTSASAGWLMIPPGTSDLLIGIDSGTAVLTVDYRDRWT